MKKQIIAILLSVTVFGFAFSEAQAKPEIGFIDTVKILQESKLGEEAITYLKKLQNDAEKEVQALEKKYKDAEAKKDSELVERITTEMQAMVYDLQNKLQVEQEAVLALITSELTNVVKKYRKDSGLLAIFLHNDVMAFDPKADITPQIMEEFNKKKIDFKSITKPKEKTK